MTTNQDSILVMYAVTPCHAGSGVALGVVDLPIQRERHTNWPMIQASGMKGAMRAHFDRHKADCLEATAIAQFDQLTDLVFGSEKSEFAGALAVSDVKILAFPMRSNLAPFVWITCPAVLGRLSKDLRLVGKAGAEKLENLQMLAKGKAWVLSGQVKGRVLLEDMEVETVDGGEAIKALDALQPYLKGADRLLLVHDEVFSYGVTSCTQVMAQIKIDQSTGTTQSGSLRYQEELPADAIMYSVLLWGSSREGNGTHSAETVAGFIRQTMASHLQIGGDETLGRGIFELTWM
ncbi:MAG: type III-B CRISPR module RAMP protein Cmr4 [Deltaproteobacteria bacterium]|nr:type III-B CRISPR module RAMP protein Cmr4 [Deltaproteobacteria bacterium]